MRPERMLRRRAQWNSRAAALRGEGERRAFATIAWWRSSLAARATFFLLASALFFAGASAVRAEPSDRPVTLVVAASPGGGVDVTARLVAAKLSNLLQQKVIVEDRNGAGTRLASDYVAKSAPDGRTLLFVTGESTIDLAFDPTARPNILEDLQPVSLIAICKLLLVVDASRPVQNVQQLLARAKAAPGKLNYSTAGIKTTMHLVGELFKLRTGTDIVNIPFNGTVPALTALVAHNVDMSFSAVPTVLPFIQAGQVRALAVASNERSPLMPDVPTLRQAGVDGVESNIWYGLLAPRGTPAAVVAALARAVDELSHSADYRQSLAKIGVEPSPDTPAAFGRMMRDEVAKYHTLIKTAGIHIE